MNHSDGVDYCAGLCFQLCLKYEFAMKGSMVVYLAILGNRRRGLEKTDKQDDLGLKLAQVRAAEVLCGRRCGRPLKI